MPVEFFLQHNSILEGRRDVVDVMDDQMYVETRRRDLLIQYNAGDIKFRQAASDR